MTGGIVVAAITMAIVFVVFVVLPVRDLANEDGTPETKRFVYISFGVYALILAAMLGAAFAFGR